MPRPNLRIALLLAAAPAVAAQTPLGTFPGSAPADYHTFAIGGVDLNGDGIPDVVVGAPNDDTGAIDGGRVIAYSGADQSELWSGHGIVPNGNFGSSLAWVDDYDLDGVPEVLMGGPYLQFFGVTQGGIYINSGSTGAILRNVIGDDDGEGFGLAVAGGFDWDLDGVTDYAVGAPLDDDGGVDAGSVSVYHGTTGSLLTTIHGDNADELFGWSLSSGLVDDNPYGDLVVGAPNADRPATPNAGMVRVYGRTGDVLWTRFGTASGDNLGYSVAVVGDVDGDGHGEVVSGAPNNDDAGLSAGRVTRYDGATGNDDGHWYGSAPSDWFGYSVAGLGDLNGDGVPEWAAGAPQATGLDVGYAEVLHGTLGFALFTLTGDQAGDLAGWTVGPAGDFNQDGIEDLLVGALSGQGPGGAVGWVRIHSGGCGSIVKYCTSGVSANGCQPTIVTNGVPRASAPSGFTVRAWPLEGDKDGLFFFGWNGRQANSWGNGSSYQCVVPPVKRGGILAGTGNPGTCTGVLLQDMNTRWFNVPTQNPGAGTIVQLQCWYRDPQNTSNQTTSTSDAIEFIVCP
jgi:hypothetical protein